MKKHIANSIILGFALWGFMQFLIWTNSLGIPEILKG
jgi:hypothetical protein